MRRFLFALAVLATTPALAAEPQTVIIDNFSFKPNVITVKPGFVNTKMTAGMKLPPLLTAEPDEVAAVGAAHSGQHGSTHLCLQVRREATCHHLLSTGRGTRLRAELCRSTPREPAQHPPFLSDFFAVHSGLSCRIRWYSRWSRQAPLMNR